MSGMVGVHPCNLHTLETFFAHEDGNFNFQRQKTTQDKQVQDSDPQKEDPMDIAVEMEGTDDSNTFTARQSRTQALDVERPRLL